MDTKRTGLSVNLQSVPLEPTVIGTVRETSQPHPLAVRVPVSGCESMGNGHATVTLAGGYFIRISAVQSEMEVPQEMTGRDIISHSTGSHMVGSSQVGPSVMHSPHSSDGELSNRGPASPTTALEPRARASPSIGSPTDTFWEGFLKEQGFCDNVIERICNSRVLSTSKHYRSQLELFVSWAVAKQLDPINASLPLFTEFMDYLFCVRQVWVRTITNQKSAIAFHWKAQCGYELPERGHHHPGLIQGFKRERPILEKHVASAILFPVGSFQILGQTGTWRWKLCFWSP